MKKCSNCGAEKPLNEYQKRKASKGGLTASCKLCLKERKEQAMRQLKASFDRAVSNGSLHKREVPAR